MARYKGPNEPEYLPLSPYRAKQDRRLIMAKKHPTTQFVVKAADPENEFPNALLGDPEGDEFDDTDATFSPDVLSCYPKIRPFPGAVFYAVGYGSLCACDADEKQVAYWSGVKDGWVLS